MRGMEIGAIYRDKTGKTINRTETGRTLCNIDVQLGLCEGERLVNNEMEIHTHTNTHTHTHCREHLEAKSS